MTNEQKARVLRAVAYHKGQLQAIEQGHKPDAQHLGDRRRQADWHLGSLLKEVAEALPVPLRQEVQACLALNDQVWSAEYANGFSEAQKDARSDSLATANER